MTLARSPFSAGRTRFGLQLRGDAKTWKGLKVFGADTSEIAFLPRDADHPGAAYTEVIDTTRLGDPVHVELWAAAPSGAHGVVESRQMDRTACNGETTYFLWEFD